MPKEISCARFVQDLLLLPVYKICARSTSFVNAQDMHKILLLLPMHKICARFYFFYQCTKYAQDLCKILLVLSDFGSLSDLTFIGAQALL